jgi:hypothetical protein
MLRPVHLGLFIFYLERVGDDSFASPEFGRHHGA